MGTCWVKFSTAQSRVSLTISGNHVENIQFYVLHAPTGTPGSGQTIAKLIRLSRVLVHWSDLGLERGLSRHLPPLRPISAQWGSTHALPSWSLRRPFCLSQLALMFSKVQALSLPPHRPYDCTIDLLPGAPLPVGRLYNLSVLKKETMRNYISESLASGIIRPFSSPVAAGFFFVAKKDGSLRPCIDYRQLNYITVKNKYPLPLLSSTFKPLTHATVFTKLDLRNAYHLVRIREGDEWKTGFNTHLGHFEYLIMPFGLTNAPAVFQALVNDVLRDFLNTFVVLYLEDILVFSQDPPGTYSPRSSGTPLPAGEQAVCEGWEMRVRRYLRGISWTISWRRGASGPTPRRSRRWSSGSDPPTVPNPGGSWDLQHFYRRFIQGFSRVAATLSALTSTLRPFSWSPEAEATFSSLKSLFILVPVLIFPDPKPSVHRGGGCVGCEHRSCPVPKLQGGPTHTSGRLPVSTLHPSRAEL